MDQLDIKISIGKGGAFFIEPIDGGRLMIKSITKPEFEIIKSFLPDYYSYILMNPNSCLSPILGVFKLKTAESDSVPPICFILMRNVLDLDPTRLNPEDKVLLFDLKGSVQGRQTLEDPNLLLNIPLNYEKHLKNKCLKDIDFFKSIQKLDITKIQSEKIISQLIADSNFLAKNNFMDYSLLVFVVIKPFFTVKPAIQNQSSQVFEERLELM